MLPAALFLLATCAVTAITGQEVLDVKLEKFRDLGADSGRAQQCPGWKQNFTLEFSPTSITLNDPLKISFDVTPLIDIKKGKLCYKLFLDQPPDFDLLYEGCRSFNCKMVSSLFAEMCPFRKGAAAKGTTEINLKGTMTVLPVGKFKLRVEIISTSGEQFLCAELHFKVPSPSYDDDYNY